MKYLIILLLFTLSACTKQEDKISVDQCLRQQLFENCMASLPKGPDSTVYNDWDEVVSECRYTAQYHSWRKNKFIKEECKAE